MGKWLWGPDKHLLTFSADGNATEHSPQGILSTTGTWKAEKDGTFSIRLKNGYSAIVTINPAGDGMHIDLTDPSGRKFILAGERKEQ